MQKRMEAEASCTEVRLLLFSTKTKAMQAGGMAAGPADGGGEPDTLRRSPTAMGCDSSKPSLCSPSIPLMRVRPGTAER